jgi:hypothetical protein
VKREFQCYRKRRSIGRSIDRLGALLCFALPSVWRLLSLDFLLAHNTPNACVRVWVPSQRGSTPDFWLTWTHSTHTTTMTPTPATHALLLLGGPRAVESIPFFDSSRVVDPRPLAGWRGRSNKLHSFMQPSWASAAGSFLLDRINPGRQVASQEPERRRRLRLASPTQSATMSSSSGSSGRSSTGGGGGKSAGGGLELDAGAWPIVHGSPESLDYTTLPTPTTAALRFYNTQGLSPSSSSSSSSSFSVASGGVAEEEEEEGGGGKGGFDDSAPLLEAVQRAFLQSLQEGGEGVEEGEGERRKRSFSMADANPVSIITERVSESEQRL